MSAAAVKITLTLPGDLLGAVDRYVATHEDVTRSGLCAEALRRWLQATQEAEIARYYLERTHEEQADDEAWTAVASASAAELWE